MKRTLIAIAFIPFLAISAQQNFNTAKTQLIKIYKDISDQQEFYCGCDFKFTGKKGVVDFASCGYEVRKNENRASRIE